LVKNCRRDKELYPIKTNQKIKFEELQVKDFAILVGKPSIIKDSSLEP